MLKLTTVKQTDRQTNRQDKKQYATDDLIRGTKRSNVPVGSYSACNERNVYKGYPLHYTAMFQGLLVVNFDIIAFVGRV